MSLSVKRAFSQNDLLYSNLPETQYNFNTTLAKRVRHGRDDILNVPDALSPSLIPQEVLPFKVSDLINTQPSSTNIVEPNYASSFGENINWPNKLQNDLSYMPPDSFTSYDSIASTHDSNILGPSFSSVQDNACYLDLESTSYYTISDETVLHQAYTDHALQSGFDDEHQIENFPDNGVKFRTDLDMSSINGASLDEWINFDWVNGLSYQAATSSLPHDSVYPRVAQAGENMSCSGINWQTCNCIDPLTDRNCATESTPKLNFRQKPYREILPLLQKPLQSGLRENQSMPNATKKPRKYSIENVNGEGKSKLGRSKSFVPERARAIAEMRIIRACLRCRIKKVSCTPGEICEACLTSAFGLERTLCVRNNVEHSTELLFPAIVNSSFHRSNIENLICENIESFCGNKISIQISSGPNYPPISLQVEEFRPTNDDFLILQHVKMNESGRIESQFMHGYTPPLSLPPHSGRSLRKKCKEHVDLIANGSRYEGELYYKHTSIVPWEIFKAIEEYYKSTKDELVGKSIALYAMNYFMAQILLFTEDSADVALKNLKHPAKLPYTRTLTSKLISLQVKEEMYKLSHEATKEVLENLEATMIDKTKNVNFWTSSFCSISILCMCMEMVQVATDFKIVHFMIGGDGSPKHSRSESKYQCQRLDDCLMSTLETMFHKVFKSRKKLGNKKHERGFNPIRDGVDCNDPNGLDAAGARLVVEIRRVIAEQEKEIGIRLETPSFDTDPDDLSNLLAEHLVFREKNSGRLVSRFLRSFFKSD